MVSFVIIFIIITTAYDVKFETQVTHAVIVTNDIVGCARPARRRRRAGADDDRAIDTNDPHVKREMRNASYSK